MIDFVTVKWRWFLGLAIICISGYFVYTNGLLVRLSPFVNSNQYEACMTAPTAECMAKLAVDAIPESYEVKDPNLLEPFVEDLVHLGHQDLVVSKLASDANSTEYWFQRRLSWVAHSRDLSLTPRYSDPSTYYLALIYNLYDHHYFGGGSATDINAAEKAAYEDRKPMTAPIGLTELDERWLSSLRKDYGRSMQRDWLDRTSFYLGLGNIGKAKEALTEAKNQPNGLLGYRFLRQLVENGLADDALDLIMGEEDQGKRGVYLSKFAWFLSQEGDVAATRSVLTSLENYRDAFDYGYPSHINALRARLKAFMNIGETERARSALDAVLSKNVLHDLAEYYLIVNDRQKAIELLRTQRDTDPEGFNTTSLQLLCRTGEVEEALSHAKTIGRTPERVAAGTVLYQCANDLSIPGYTYEFISNELDIGTGYQLLSAHASRQVITGKYREAAKTIEKMMIERSNGAQQWQYITDRDILRLAVAIRDQNLIMAVLKQIMNDARYSKDMIGLVSRLTQAAAITEKIHPSS